MSNPCSSCLSSVERTVLEESTFRYAGVLTDDKEETVADTDLQSFTLTLYDKLTGAIINLRDAQSILNTNGGTVDQDGNFVWTAEPPDNPILDATIAPGVTEEHIALFEWTYNGGIAIGRHQLEIFVKQLTKVSDA